MIMRPSVVAPVMRSATGGRTVPEDMLSTSYPLQLEELVRASFSPVW